MRVKGIQISDGDFYLTPSLNQILKAIPNGISFHWAFLELYAIGPLKGKSVPEFERQINKSDNGLIMEWAELEILAPQFTQIIDLTLIASLNKNLLKRYDTDQSMFESCDITIELLDSSYWQIFSKQSELIEKLASQYKKVERIESDFEKKYEKN